MDIQSLWLKNRRLLDTIDDFEYKRKEIELIETCFGGTKNMIKLILKNQHNLSYIQQKQLLRILKKPLPQGNDNDHVLNASIKSEPKGIILSNLNENCLSYIFQYLTQYERSAFSSTSRNICIASKNKNSNLNYDILEFPFHILYHFIHKISDINNTSSLEFTQETEAFIEWINTQSITRHQKQLTIICESGLLFTFSNLMTTSHHIPLIANILCLFNILSQHRLCCPYLVNVNLIENLTLFTLPLIDKDSALIPDIINIIHNLFFHKDHMQTAVRNRVFESQFIHSVIIISSEASLISATKDVLWIMKALELIREWVQHYDEKQYPKHAERIKSAVIPHCIHKINKVIDVTADKTWIYQLLSKGHEVFIRDPNDDDDDNDDGIIMDDYEFVISDIINISPQTDSNPSITLIGRFRAETNVPNRRISVPLSHVHCIGGVWTQSPLFIDIMNTFQAICNLIFSYNNCYVPIDFRKSACKRTKEAIYRIINISNKVRIHRLHGISQNGILLNLLKSDWLLFMDLFGPQIERRFCSNHESDLYPLLRAASDTNNLENLCRLQWFKDHFVGGRLLERKKDTDTHIEHILETISQYFRKELLSQ